ATEETEGLVGVDFLARMKPEAYVVNTAAPAVVDAEALAVALRGGRLAGAALDVHEVEPLPPSHPLLGLENALLTPHIGGATVDVRGLFGGLVMDQAHGPAIYAATGHLPTFLMAPARLAWFRDNAPEAYAAIALALPIDAWLGYRLCGEAASPVASAGECGLL